MQKSLDEARKVQPDTNSLVDNAYKDVQNKTVKLDLDNAIDDNTQSNLGFMKFGEPLRIECKNVKRKRKSAKKALVEKNQNIIGFLKQDEKIAEKINENLEEAILEEMKGVVKRRKLDGP